MAYSHIPGQSGISTSDAVPGSTQIKQSTSMSGFLRINRTGMAIVEQAMHNQCRDINHRRYRYHVAAVVKDDHLDEMGFIIDHAKLSEIAEAEIMRSGSCEQMAIRTGMAVKNAVGPGSWVYVSIRPLLDGGELAPSWMEWNSDMDFQFNEQ